MGGDKLSQAMVDIGKAQMSNGPPPHLRRKRHVMEFEEAEDETEQTANRLPVHEERWKRGAIKTQEVEDDDMLIDTLEDGKMQLPVVKNNEEETDLGSTDSGDLEFSTLLDEMRRKADERNDKELLDEPDRQQVTDNKDWHLRELSDVAHVRRRRAAVNCVKVRN